MKSINQLKSELEDMEKRLETLDEMENLRIEIRRVEELIETLETLERDGFLYKKCSDAPDWYCDEESVHGKRANASSGTSYQNEWYVYIDEAELRKAILKDDKVYEGMTFYDGKYYKPEDTYFDRAKDEFVLKKGAEPLDIHDLISIASAF